jgi:hypothetical protein
MHAGVSISLQGLDMSAYVKKSDLKFCKHMSVVP